MSDPDWYTQAACRGMATGLFYSDSPAAIAKAHAACRICPVVTECAAAGVDEYGVWGGREVKKNGRPRKPINHGTESGYQQHKRRGDSGEAICGPCRTAWAAAARNREAARRQQGEAAA